MNEAVLSERIDNAQQMIENSFSVEGAAAHIINDCLWYVARNIPEERAQEVLTTLFADSIGMKKREIIRLVYMIYSKEEG